MAASLSLVYRVSFAFAVVPQTQSRTRPRHAWSAEDHDKECAENFFSWIHAQFPARGENRFPQHFETAKFPQREAKINFFSGKVLLIEAANRLKVAARREKKRACAKIESEIKNGKSAQENAAP